MRFRELLGVALCLCLCLCLSLPFSLDNLRLPFLYRAQSIVTFRTHSWLENNWRSYHITCLIQPVDTMSDAILNGGLPVLQKL